MCSKKYVLWLFMKLSLDEAMLTHTNINKEHWLLYIRWQTCIKVRFHFIRVSANPQLFYLEEQRQVALHRLSAIIQKTWRGFVAWREFQLKKKSQIVISKYVKCYQVGLLVAMLSCTFNCYLLGVFVANWNWMETNGIIFVWSV